MTPNLLDELEGVVAKINAFRNLPFDAERRKLYTDASSAATEFLRTHHATLADMAKRIEALQYLAAAMYQAAGAYDMPVRFLDVLSAAGNGEAITEEQVDALLPCETPDTLQRLEAAERDAARYRWLRDEAGNDILETLKSKFDTGEFDAAIDAAQEGE